MKGNIILRWENIFSGETGFVQSVSKTKGYFINTVSPREAKGYKSQKQVETDLDILHLVGETQNNRFFMDYRSNYI